MDIEDFMNCLDFGSSVKIHFYSYLCQPLMATA